MAQLTVYPDPNPETTTVDGTVIAFTDNTAWGTLHDRTTADIVDDTSAVQNAGRVTNGTNNNFRIISRGIFSFDTTSIPTNSSVDSAVLTFVSGGGSENDLTPAQSVQICSKTTVAAGLVAGDLDPAGFGTTSFGSQTCATWAAAADGVDVSYTLNASGLSFIQDQVIANAITALGVRMNSDMTNTAPDYVGSQTASGGRPYNADQAGTASDPELVINYTEGGLVTFTPKMMMY